MSFLFIIVVVVVIVFQSRDVGQMWKEGDVCLAKYWEDNRVCCCFFSTNKQATLHSFVYQRTGVSSGTVLLLVKK